VKKIMAAVGIASLVIVAVPSCKQGGDLVIPPGAGQAAPILKPTPTRATKPQQPAPSRLPGARNRNPAHL